jgi:hypothetical protein
MPRHLRALDDMLTLMLDFLVIVAAGALVVFGVVLLLRVFLALIPSR